MTEVELTLSPHLFGGNTPGLITHLGLYGRHLGATVWAVRAPRSRGGQTDARLNRQRLTHATHLR